MKIARKSLNLGFSVEFRRPWFICVSMYLALFKEHYASNYQ